MGIEGAREPARGPGGAHHPSFSTHKMRYTAQAGLGELNAQIAEANRLFRLSELGENPAPHVITLSDVTRGIISDQVDQQKIQGLILDTPVDFSAKTPSRSTEPSPPRPWVHFPIRSRTAASWISDAERAGSVRD